MNEIKYKCGDIIEMKKAHPCSNRSKQFQLIEVSGEVKIKCLGCGTVITMKRYDFDNRIVKNINNN